MLTQIKYAITALFLLGSCAAITVGVLVDASEDYAIIACTWLGLLYIVGAALWITDE